MRLFPDLSRRVAAAMVAITLVGCASAPTRLQPLPETLSAQAGIPGIPGAPVSYTHLTLPTSDLV